MSNKTKRNLALVMVCLSVVLYILIFVEQIFFHYKPDWWMWVAAPCCFVVFLGLYRNFSQAVKEDDKYGPMKK
ncbi:MAG: hypothetical protein J1E63_05210 [Muribaculaceae bacterium]|nr:hypothetical protein [Muribaculaceae bacterium]